MPIPINILFTYGGAGGILSLQLPPRSNFIQKGYSKIISVAFNVYVYICLLGFSH